MKVTVDIHDTLLAALLERSSATNATAEEVLNSLLAAALEQPEHEAVDLAQAILSTFEVVRKIPVGDSFLVEDVIPADLWQAMSPGVRKSFGKSFRKQVEEAGLALWESRTSGNKAVYRRIHSGKN